jgi:hypothetical protein
VTPAAWQTLRRPTHNDGPKPNASDYGPGLPGSSGITGAGNAAAHLIIVASKAIRWLKLPQLRDIETDTRWWESGPQRPAVPLGTGCC